MPRSLNIKEVLEDMMHWNIGRDCTTNNRRGALLGIVSLVAAVAAALIEFYVVSGDVESSPGEAPPAEFLSVIEWSGLITMTGVFTAGGDMDGTPSARFGVCPTCTEDFEFGPDTGTSTFIIPKQLEAFLFYPANNPNFFGTNHQKLSVSRIADGPDLTWPLKLFFQAADAGKGVDISMTSAEIADIPGAPDRRVALLDSGGIEIADLRASTFVVSLIIPGAPHQVDFTIRVFSPPPLPPGPTLVSPASGDRFNDSTPFFQWQTGTGDFDSYRVRVTSGDITTGPFDIDEVIVGAPPPTQFQTPVGKALADGSNQWHVRAETGGVAASDFSDPPFVFTVDTTPPGPPFLLRPVSGDISDDNTPFFEWTPSSGDVVDYLLQVTSADTFNPHLDIEVVIAHPGTGHQAVTPLNNGTYRWRVIAGDALGNKAFSATRTFAVAAQVRNLVTGTVVLEGRSEHGGARVSFAGPEQVVTETLSDGSFAVLLGAGIYTFTLEKDGFLTATKLGLEVSQDITLPLVKLLGGDVNGDGVIDVNDLVIPAKNLGKRESSVP